MSVYNQIANLKNNDIYSLILFALYKIKDIPQYSTLSELLFILDKESVLKLFEYYGGMTITIPTIKELEDIVYLLLLYQYVHIEHLDFNDAVEKLGKPTYDLRELKTNFSKLEHILESYNFQT